MKKLKILLLSLVLISIASYSIGWIMFPVVSGVAGGGCADSSCTGFLVCQNFEGSGYDNSESWSESVGTNGIVDEDDQTATVLRGSYQLKIYGGDAGQTSSTYIDFASTSDLYVHFKFKVPSLPAGDRYIAQIRNSGGSSQAEIYIRSAANGQTIRMTAGGGSATTVATYSANTEYHLWFHYNTDGTGSIGFSETTTEPTSGDNYATYSSGNTNAITRLQLRADNQATYYFDQILAKSSSIGNVCN